MKKSAAMTLALLGWIVPSAALADPQPAMTSVASAADALMDAVRSPAGANGTAPSSLQAQTLASEGEIKLTDPFLMQFFTSWQTQRQSGKGLSFDADRWAMKVVRHRFDEAAHLWSAIQPGLPEDFASAAQAAQLYSLYRLDLPHTFMEQYLAALQRADWAESRPFTALGQTLAQGLDRWLLDRRLVPSEQQESLIQTLPKRGMLEITLKAWASTRKGAQALPVLESLPVDHAFKIPLGQTAALALARGNDLAGAASVLKRHVEPALEIRKDARALSSHYLQVARLLYQAGSLDGAEVFYLRIPSGSPDFLKAREELAWVWLRKGDVSRLRGELTTLSSRYFDDKFAPEVPLIRAISNLKLCYYGEVAKDLDAFVSDNRVWAERIASALKTEEPPSPARTGNPDFFADRAEGALSGLRREAEALERLADQSVSAALPAVGRQRHWVLAKESALAAVETARKRLVAERRRQWGNDRFALTEAIRKMKFVRIELLTQVRLAARPAQDDRIVVSAAAPERSSSAGEMVFPMDGIPWTDELFNLRSMAQGRCLQAPGGT